MPSTPSTISPHPSGSFSTQEFPSCLFRIPEGGARVIWEITNTCNYNCVYCIFSSGQKHIPSELSKAEVLKVIDQLKLHGFTHLKITGGEPFVRDDLIEILQYATNLNFYVDVSTNASLLSGKKVKALKAMNIPLVHVSLDGYNMELQEKVRGSDTFNRTVSGIKKLVAEGIYVRIGSLIYKGNEKHLEDMIKFCIDLGVNEVIFSRMEAVGRMRDDESLITDLPSKSFMEELTNYKIKYADSIKVNFSFTEKKNDAACGSCPGGTKFLYIDHLGRISPCTWISEFFPHYRSKETLHKNSFQEIMGSEQIGSYLKMIAELNKNGLGCPAKALKDVEAYEHIEKMFQGSLENTLKTTEKFAPYSCLYSFTTENIGGYFSQIDFRGKSVLTVGGSGDHLINASLLGAKDVTCFDKNVMAKFYAELKFQAVKKLPFIVFKEFFLRNSKQPLSFETYQKLETSLSPITRYFWEKIYKHFKNNGSEIRESALFNNLHDHSSNKVDYNPYLSSEEQYLQAQKSLSSKTFKWINSSLEKLTSLNAVRTRKFDVILLSNIADYAERIFPDDKQYFEKFNSEIISPLSQQLSPDGILCFAYLYKSDQREGKLRNKFYDLNLLKQTFTDDQFSYSKFDFKGVDKGNDTIAYLKCQI